MKLQESKGASCQNRSQLLVSKKCKCVRERNAVACQFLHSLPLWIPLCFNYVLCSADGVGHKCVTLTPNFEYTFYLLLLRDLHRKKFSISCGVELTWVCKSSDGHE